MRLVYFGSGQFAVPILRSVLGAGHEVLAVVTQPDRPAGRGRKLRPTPVKELALERGLRVIAVEKVNDPAITQEILGLGARIGVVAAFGQKIGKGLLEGFPAGLINAHASLLPKFRGAAPINWAIINAEDETGVTVFRLVERMDAGAMFLKRRTYIKPGETAEELESRLGGIACDAVKATLELFKDCDNPPDGSAGRIARPPRPPSSAARMAGSISPNPPGRPPAASAACGPGPARRATSARPTASSASASYSPAPTSSATTIPRTNPPPARSCPTCRSRRGRGPSA